MHRALFSHGWNPARDGVPCSQDELAYTLLTFGYVFLRSMRKLGLGLPHEDELAYLHAWNVMGHVLGMETTLMAETMEEGEALFARLQARGRADVEMITDARPALGQALMKTMEAVIPLRAVKPFPVLLTRYLCGKTTAKNIGIDHCVAWYSRMLFFVVMLITRHRCHGAPGVPRFFDLPHGHARGRLPVHGAGADGPDPPPETAARAAGPGQYHDRQLARRSQGAPVAQQAGTAPDRPRQGPSMKLLFACIVTLLTLLLSPVAGAAPAAAAADTAPARLLLQDGVPARARLAGGGGPVRPARRAHGGAGAGAAVRGAHLRLRHPRRAARRSVAGRFRSRWRPAATASGCSTSITRS
ncbi:DUF2236 domain-containing protein [Massilia sp. B-10]|nr:DUF2236 domain-containing protein [Massilia sp. B-10]